MNTIQRNASAKQSKSSSKAKKSSKQITTRKTGYSKAKLARMTTEELALLAYEMTYKRVHSKRKTR